MPANKPATRNQIKNGARPKRPPNALGGKSRKADIILKLLRRSQGATAAGLCKATGWQTHSVRGFLSGELKKKRGLAVQSERIGGVLRYRLAKGE